MSARKLAPEEVDTILDRYRHGESVTELAAEYDVTKAGIYWHVSKHGAHREYRRHATDDELAELVALVVPGPWVDDALCAQVDAEIFFPDTGGSTREAKTVCAACEVRAQCLDYALRADVGFGVWGGLSERERRRVKHGEQPPAPRVRTCPGCGNEFHPYHGSRLYCTEDCRLAVKRAREAAAQQRRAS